MKVLFALFIAAVSLSAAPNYVLIFCDDLGYGDLGCYGSKKNRTPRIDQLAREGMRFTDFYSSSPVCTPSRASLMTGCYARRVGMHEDFTGHWVRIAATFAGHIIRIGNTKVFIKAVLSGQVRRLIAKMPFADASGDITLGLERLR
jgi:hypothetical protein